MTIGVEGSIVRWDLGTRLNSNLKAKGFLLLVVSGGSNILWYSLAAELLNLWGTNCIQTIGYYCVWLEVHVTPKHTDLILAFSSMFGKITSDLFRSEGTEDTSCIK